MQCQFLAGLALAFAPALSFADTCGPGYAHDSVTPLSALTAFAAYDTLSNGNRVVYDGSQVWIENDAGTVIQVLGNPSTPSFASFIEADPTETFAVLGENNNGQLFKVSLTTGNPTPLCTLAFNFDIAYESSNSALVSAAAIAFGSNEIYRVNLTTGATSLVAAVSGPSGPIALSPAGDLYYATQTLVFPAPPASTNIIRWTSNQITNGPFPLTEARASMFTPGFDGAGYLTFDTVFGNLFVSVGLYSAPSSIVEIDKTGAIVASIAVSPHTTGKVEVIEAPGAGACAAFQPDGRRLFYRATDFFNGGSRIEKISPRRPVLTSVQNLDNTMTCTLVGGWPNATAYVISGNVSQYTTPETAYDLTKHLFWTGMPLNQIRRAGITFATDASGNGSFTFSNPPGSQGLFVIQALVSDPTGVYRGTSTAAFN
jgi:hypothetical protein